MLRLLCVSFLLSVSVISHAGMFDTGPANEVAPNPRFEVFVQGNKTQITYTNGDITNPEIFIIVCNAKNNKMDFQYYLRAKGEQVTTANYITILSYPPGWITMGHPYQAPSEVIYDSGMGLSKSLFASALRRIEKIGDKNIVITFEGITSEYNTETIAWSDIIPSSIFKRDLSNKNITNCADTEERELLPLLRMNHETE